MASSPASFRLVGIGSVYPRYPVGLSAGTSSASSWLVGIGSGPHAAVGRGGLVFAKAKPPAGFLCLIGGHRLRLLLGKVLNLLDWWLLGHLALLGGPPTSPPLNSGAVSGRPAPATS